jgi:hypothetical protein
MVQPLTLEKHATTHRKTAGNDNPMTKPNFLDVVLNSTASEGPKLITNMRTEHTQNLNYCDYLLRMTKHISPQLLLMFYSIYFTFH